MSAISQTFSRSVSSLLRLNSVKFCLCAFLSVVAFAFAYELKSPAQGISSIQEFWALSVGRALPILVAVLGMDLWSGEYRTGRIELLLSSAVREKDLVVGKFLSVFVLSSLFMMISAISSGVILNFWAGVGSLKITGFSFFGAIVMLLVQCLLWSSVVSAASALCHHGASAAVIAVLVSFGIPRGAWAAAIAFMPTLRDSSGLMVFDAQVIDAASGMFSLATVGAYVVFTVFFLLVAVVAVGHQRLRSRGARTIRKSSYLAVFFALIVALLSVTLAFRIDVPLDVDSCGEKRISRRTLDALKDVSGEFAISAYVTRSDQGLFRDVSHYLRTLKTVAYSSLGVSLRINYVDPQWDSSAVKRLNSAGVKDIASPHLVFEEGRRKVALKITGFIDDRAVASAIMRLSKHIAKRKIYWTIGHDEYWVDGSTPEEVEIQYGPYGLSDIARDLNNEGYQNQSLDIIKAEKIPEDCALIIIAGAKTVFSRSEFSKIDSYLKKGGRVLVLTDSYRLGGISTYLPQIGLRVSSDPVKSEHSTDGADVIVSQFSDHRITEPLSGTRVLMTRPVVFSPSSAVGIGADRVDFFALASVSNQAVSAIVERGAGAGEDLSYRPSRVAVFGDSSFILNGALKSRANSNRDMFLNTVGYLVGVDMIAGTAVIGENVFQGMSLSQHKKFIVLTSLAVPLSVWIILWALALSRRRRA